MTPTTRLTLAAMLAALALPPALGDDWNDPQEPFAIFGNTYYVGVRGLSSVLITSPAGHILIDGGSPKSPAQIVKHIGQLGFRIEDVKYILNSHEHFDHAGGIAELQRLSGATVLASVASEKVLRSGKPDKGDPQYTELPPAMAAVANTRAVKDGETVKLGPLSVTAHATPGHTQGGASWTWRSSEGGKTASMVYADSLNAISAGPFRYSANNTYPQARADLEKSIATVAALDCDVLVSAHPEGSGLWERLARQATVGNTAFIDRNACRDYAEAARERLARKLAAEANEAANDGTRLRAIVGKAIRPVMVKYDVPGIAVAVTVDGKAHFFNYGLASVEDNKPVTQATLFELGSISKTLTATLASYAQATGKLSLDAHPSAYMPQLKGSAIDKASVLNLGTYTAGGLPLQFPEELKDEQMAAYFQQWTAQAAPGTQRRYSNPSLGLFGHVTALALQSNFADAMEQQLFPRLGLTNTYMRVPATVMAKHAWGYDEHNKARRMDPGVLAAEGYGVRSSSADMIRFLQVNIAPGQLDEAARRAVEGTHIGYFQVGPMVQGLGWEQYPWPASLQQLQAGNARTMIMEANPAKRIAAPTAPSTPTLFNKTGSTGGFGNYVAFVPAKKIGVVILANKNYPIPARINAGHAILKQLAP